MEMKKVVLFISLSLLSGSVMASCTRVTSLSSSTDAAAIAAGYTAASWAGSADTYNAKSIGLPHVISLSNSSSFQPSGTLLASGLLTFLGQSYQTPYSAKQVLFRCAVSDGSALYEMYATNGDNAYTGTYAVSEVDGAYYSYVKNVAVRLTNTATGEYYSRYWKARQLTADDWFSNGTYIYIPAGAFSNVLMEIFKIDSTTYYGNASNSYAYYYSQPHGYIAFRGGGLSANATAGADSMSSSNGFYDAWPGQWSLYNTGVTFVRGALCKVNDYPNVVLLPTISTNELDSGGASQTSFSVSIECESGAVSSTSTSTTSSANVSMGFLVNQANALSQAQALGLVTSSGGLTWLLDNNYGSGGNEASGVGIKIYNRSGSAMNLLPDVSSTGGGNLRGWYAYKDVTSQTSSGGTNIFTGDFTASLEALSGQTITAGTVNAQLQVVVSFQ